MRSRRHAVATVALMLAALMAGCGDEETDKLSVTDGPVEGGNGFNPAKLEAHKGSKVEITVTNTAPDKQHGFSIDEFKVSEVVDQGKTSTIKFDAEKAGTYRIYCQLHPTHKAAELVVS